MKIQSEKIRDYLNLLDPISEYFTCLIFDADTNKVLNGNLYEKVDSIIATLEYFADKNPTLHVTLNACNPNGHTAKHVIKTRVLCVDIDVVKTKEEIRDIVEVYRVHFVVQSSPGKYHLYWVTDNLPFETWQKYQRALAFKLGGDLNLDQLAKNIRVPGVPRKCKDGSWFLPELVFCDSGLIKNERITVGGFVERYPWWELSEKDCILAKKEKTKRDDSSLNKFRKSGYSGVVTVELGRNDTLYRVVNTACYKERLSLEAAHELATRINNAFGVECKGPLGEEEVSVVVESAHRAASTALERRKEKDTEKAKQQLEHINMLKEVPTNGASEPFIYDYSRGAMLDCWFSSSAVVEMVGQKYGPYIVRVGTVLYAFCPETLTWLPQKPVPTVLDGFSDVCIRDIFRDKRYFYEFPKLSDMSKFLSNSFVSGVNHGVALKRYRTKKGSDFDRCPNLLFCANGVVDLDTGRVRNSTPEDYLLLRSNITFDAGAECPRWKRFVLEVFADNDDPSGMVEFLQDVFGYSITGSINRQKLYVHFGSGSNGKSKVLQALGRLVGEYGTMMAGTSLAKSKNAFQKELERIGAKIEGKRIVIVDDLDTATQWNEGIVKNLTGPQIMARKLYEEERDIPNRAKFHIGCNEKPTPESENYAILRRLCMIPYRKQFEPSDDKEAELQEMIDLELPGILNWAIKGYRLNKERCLEEPKEVKYALQEYKYEHFTVEGIIVQLFSKPDSLKETKENWHTVSDLVEYVNDHLNNLGKGGKKTSNDKLGSILKNTMHLNSSKLRHKGLMTRGYFVVFEKIENSSLLSKLQ